MVTEGRRPASGRPAHCWSSVAVGLLLVLGPDGLAVLQGHFLIVTPVVTETFDRSTRRAHDLTVLEEPISQLPSGRSATTPPATPHPQPQGPFLPCPPHTAGLLHKEALLSLSLEHGKTESQGTT